MVLLRFKEGVYLERIREHKQETKNIFIKTKY